MSDANTTFLRRVLLLDAVASGATGVLALVGADVLQQILAVPAPLLRWAGVILIPFAALLVYLARKSTVSRIAVWDVVVINIAWVIASFALLAEGWIAPNPLGIAFIAAQAIAVAGLTAMEWIGLQRSSAAAA